MKLIILDRDGVINEESALFIKTIDEWRPIAKSAEGIAKLNRAGYKICIATNQSGIGRKLLTRETLNTIHKKMITHIESYGGKISGIWYCPHLPQDNCNCRKPKTGMIEDILSKYPTVDITKTFLVGDSLRDLQSIAKLGGKPVLVLTGKGQETLNIQKAFIPKNSLIFENLWEFAHFIAHNKRLN